MANSGRVPSSGLRDGQGLYITAPFPRGEPRSYGARPPPGPGIPGVPGRSRARDPRGSRDGPGPGTPGPETPGHRPRWLFGDPVGYSEPLNLRERPLAAPDEVRHNRYLPLRRGPPGLGSPSDNGSAPLCRRCWVGWVGWVLLADGMRAGKCLVLPHGASVARGPVPGSGLTGLWLTLWAVVSDDTDTAGLVSGQNGTQHPHGQRSRLSCAVAPPIRGTTAHAHSINCPSH